MAPDWPEDEEGAIAGWSSIEHRFADPDWDLKPADDPIRLACGRTIDIAGNWLLPV